MTGIGKKLLRGEVVLPDSAETPLVLNDMGFPKPIPRKKKSKKQFATLHQLQTRRKK